MHPRKVEELSGSLELLEEALERIARLSALALLGEKEFSAKLARAGEMVAYVGKAAELEHCLLRYFTVRPRNVFWPEDAHPENIGITHKGTLNFVALSKEIAALKSAAARTTADIAGRVATNPLLEPEAILLSQIAKVLPEASGGYGLSCHASRPTSTHGVTKSLTGPHEVAIDPVFAPAYSLREKPVPAFGDSAAEAAPFFWSLAIRESMASDLCALSMAEYDGLPLAFYRDMAKQTWDEIRHAVYCLDTALMLLPELETELPYDHSTRAAVQRFRETGTGLPVPMERNLYEAIVNASLVERLVLLHHDTETPAIRTLKEKIGSQFCQDHPDISVGLAIFRRDEIAHSRLGNVWFNHLVPDVQKRNTIIANTRLLRGVLLLTSFAHHGDDSFGDLMENYSSS
jgi:hypothetical protein